jgi:hypothetical protein
MIRAQNWLMALQERGWASHDGDDGSIQIGPEAARSFAYGRAAGRSFVGFAPEHRAWARGLPWSHAAVRIGRPELYIITHPIDISGIRYGPLALRFALDGTHRSQGYAQTLQLDLREVLANSEHGPSLMCTRAFECIPIRTLADDEPAFARTTPVRSAAARWR